MGPIRRVALAVACALPFAVLPGSALALSGAPTHVGTPYSINGLSVATDSSGTGLIAWANDKDLFPTTVNVINYCVIPAGATACSHTGTLTPADGAGYIDGVQTIVDGGTAVILADVYGAQGTSAADYEPEQEWQSTDGGASWSLVNGGLSVTSGILNADTGPLGGVIVPGTNVLGFGWQTPGTGPTFNAFPLNAPPECSKASCGQPYAQLEPPSNPDQVTNGGGVFASTAGAHPGVLNVMNTNFTNGPLGCAASTGLAYAYGAGNQSAGNSYNVSPGMAGSAWVRPITQLGCNLEYPAAGGGPSGLGLLAKDLGTNREVYKPFNGSTMSWGGSSVVDPTQGGLYPSVSQDGAGGIYATYLGNSADAIKLGYSGNGGTSWHVNTLNPNSDLRASYLTSAVNGAGQGWAAWFDNGDVIAQPFVATDAYAPAAATSSSTATTSGGTVTVTITCSGPCTVTITISTSGGAATDIPTAARAHGVTVAKGKVTIKAGGKTKVKLKLTAKGKRLLKRHHGKLKATIHLTTATLGHTFHTSHSLRIHR